MLITLINMPCWEKSVFWNCTESVLLVLTDDCSFCMLVKLKNLLFFFQKYLECAVFLLDFIWMLTSVFIMWQREATRVLFHLQTQSCLQAPREGSRFNSRPFYVEFAYSRWACSISSTQTHQNLSSDVSKVLIHCLPLRYSKLLL